MQKFKYLTLCFILFILLIFKKIIPKFNLYKKKRFIKDVLFISGYKSKSDHQLYRFRILHQKEQLNAGFMESDDNYYLKFDPLSVRDYRIIIFFRCPWTKKVEESILLAKSLNKRVLFDIDELVFDTKFTNTLPHIKSLSVRQKDKYDDIVLRMRKTLKLCEGAITSTQFIANEIKHYVSNVFVNHNVASEIMWKLSQKALINIDNKKDEGNIIIGYFSESFSNYSDFEMIKSALLKILKEFKQVQILLMVDNYFPDYLNEFSSQIIFKKFIDWRKMPEIIANIDINIVPLQNNSFNYAKSEMKWVEVSMVKVPTIASNLGIFKEVINHNETGLLCSDLSDWYISLKTLINNKYLRKLLGENAYNICKEEYNTIHTGYRFANYINSISNKHIGFYLPSLNNCGGIYVILMHAYILKEIGWDVDLIIPKGNIDLFTFEGQKFNVISIKNCIINSQYDIIVATLFTTLYSIINYFKTKKHLYLVQGYETDFASFMSKNRFEAEKTYSVNFNLEYITISKWCESWLWKKYKKKARYAPNGIDFDNTRYYRRNLNKKRIRILIEGDNYSFYKNVDESFKIISKLDKKRFEVWYLCNHGAPKEWYIYDKFYHKIPHDKVKEIYYECDILIKSSWLESFSYPPLEMMATGGYVIVAPNNGNKEYLIDKQNCLFYKLGDVDSAVQNINTLISDDKLQTQLYKNGLETAKKRNWNNLKEQIIKLYNT